MPIKKKKFDEFKMLFRGDMKHLNIIDFEQLDGIRVNNSDVFEGFVSIFYSKFYFGAI